MRNPVLKVLDVAKREYRATAMTRAFLFGVVLFPLIIWAVIAVVIPLFDSPDKRLTGTIEVLDRTDPSQPVATKIESIFDPQRLQAEYDARRSKLEADSISEDVGLAEQRKALGQLKKMPEGPHEVTIKRLPAETDIEARKADVISGATLALVSIGPEALEPPGVYDMFTGRSLDIELSNRLTDAIDRAVVDARLSRADFDPAVVRTLTATPLTRAVTITEAGETKSNALATFMLPMAFMMLLWIAVFSSGQYLLTTTIEEKSTRVMELLLSAVSPMQLMTGKILGQAAVGLTILLIYAGLGLAAASQFNILKQVPTDKLPWLAVYFVMAYFLIGSMMAAIGSAVNELREAQSLMGVVMIVLMLPMFLWTLIIRQPNSTFAVVASMIPPMTPFVMILRLAQTSEPIPTWQIVLATAIGFGAVFVAIWAAAKIFRVGVLMYGKPPSLGTLLKWIRYA